MQETLEKGKDKIQRICDALRKETLEPALQEADKIVAEAKVRAEHIIKEAHMQAEKLLSSAREAIHQERNVFHSSLEQAGKQGVQALKQAIEETLFSNELRKVVERQSSDSKIIAKLLASIVHAIEKEGIETQLSAVIPSVVSVDEVNRLLGEEILKKLREGSVTLGEFAGGAQVKLLDKKMTIDITDEALIELLSNYVRKDFRKLLFVS